jgi:four helix bundle protein
MLRYENLEIYNRAIDLTMECYSITEEYPQKELFSLAQQINRAAISIPSNIAEGVGRYSDKDKKHFLNMSYSSLLEVLCQLEISKKLGYVDIDAYDSFKRNGETLLIKISNFVKYLDKK